jgi:hypothetical protein
MGLLFINEFITGYVKLQLLRNRPYAIIDEKLKAGDTIERKAIYHTG